MLNHALPRRSRFIFQVVAAYAVFSVGWILLSDRLLLALTDPITLTQFSTWKGLFFVLASTGALFLALRAVPDAVATPGATAPCSHAAPAQYHWPGSCPRRALGYAFAVALTLGMLLLVGAMPPAYSDRPSFTLLMLPIVLSALVGGWRPGMVATLGLNVVATAPLWSAEANRLDQFECGILIANGLVISLLSEAQRRASSRLAYSQQLLDSVVSGTTDAVFIKDAQGRYLLINAAAAAMVRQPVAHIVGADDSRLFDAASAQALMRHDRAVMERGTVQTYEELVITQNGQAFTFHSTKGPLRDRYGRVCGLFGISRDISQLKAHEAELERVAHYDGLTGLPNRRLLSDRLNQSIKRAERSGKSSAICFLDLDNFKAVNDLHGHQAGDQLLVGITESLQHVLRAEDTLARMGGDEFVIILSDITTPEECTLVLDRILAAARQTVVLEGRPPIHISASVGVSLYPADNADPDTLLRHADQAMYLAKQAGKNRYQLFDPEIDRQAQLHRSQLEWLRRALLEQQFVLFYQPKVDLVNGQVLGVEALIRWQHPTQGLLAPSAFLPYVQRQ